MRFKIRVKTDCSDGDRMRSLILSLVPLADVPYIDRPSIQVSAAESVEMPFKYVKGKDGKAIMPEVSGLSRPYILCSKLTSCRA